MEETIQKFKEEWTSGTSLAPSVIVHSLAASAIDTANMIGKEIKVGRDRIMPEYTYLDPRAVGIFDGMPLRTTEEAVWALDVDQAGPNGQVSKRNLVSPVTQTRGSASRKCRLYSPPLCVCLY